MGRREGKNRRGGFFGPGPRRAGGGGRGWGGRRRLAMAGGGAMGGTRPRYMPRRGGRGGIGSTLLGVIVILAILGVVLWLFLRSGGAGGSTESTSSNGTATSSSATVESNGTDLLGLAANGASSDFEPYENQPVHASNVPVEATVGNGVFWIGTSSENRLLVVANGSAPSVNPGDVVSLDGTLRVLPVDFATRYGVSDGIDQSDLQRTGHFIEADQIQT